MNSPKEIDPEPGSFDTALAQHHLRSNAKLTHTLLLGELPSNKDGMLLVTLRGVIRDFSLT